MSTGHKKSNAICVMVTAPPPVAAELARGIVADRLAACVQRLPVQSVYRWENEIHDDEEVLLICKTTAARYPALQEWLLARHPYAVPQITSLAIDQSLPAYLSWLQTQTQA